MITLKKLKVYERLSEETTCYTTDIYFNGKLAGRSENRGQGGCSNAHPALGKDPSKYAAIRAVFDEACAWAKTQPDAVMKSLLADEDVAEARASRGEVPDPDPKHTSLESYVDELVEAERIRKTRDSFISRNVRKAASQSRIAGFRTDGREDTMVLFPDTADGRKALALTKPPLLSLAGLSPKDAVAKVEEYLASLTA